MKLIVCLGNPGKEYVKTRHNAGFMAADFLREHFGMEDFKLSKKHNAEVTEGDIVGEKAVIAKPQTYMNLSGDSVRSLVDFYKIEPRDVIVIHDEVDLPLGTLRVRPTGSSGGHNGIKSLIAALGADFIRVRLGIAPAEPFLGALEDYVLGKFSAEEREALDAVIEKLPPLIETLFKEGVEAVMQRFN